MKISLSKEIQVLNFEMQNQLTSSPVIDMASPVFVKCSSSCSKVDNQESCFIDISSEDEIILNDSSQDFEKLNINNDNSSSMKEESKVSFTNEFIPSRKRREEKSCSIISGANNNLSIVEVINEPRSKKEFEFDCKLMEDMKIDCKSTRKEREKKDASESCEFEIIEVVDSTNIEEKVSESVKGSKTKKRKLKNRGYLSVKPYDFNSSVEILQEINSEPQAKKKRKGTDNQQSVRFDKLQSEQFIDSVVNLCGDEDDDIVVVDLGPKDLAESRKSNTRTDDIIPLISEQNLNLNVTPKRKKSKKINQLSKKSKSKLNAVTMPPPRNTSVHYEPLMYVPPVQPCSYMVPYYFVDTVGNSNSSDVLCNNNSESSQTTTQCKQSVQVSPLNNAYGSNIYNPNPQQEQTGLRPIIIDGSNVAFGHSVGTMKAFSCRGLEICIYYFLKRGHKVVAFVPQFRKSSPHVVDRSILEELAKKGLVVFTPSRRVEGHLQVPYDDRFIVQYAAEVGGVIVSTDNYRDLLRENESWRETIQERLLMFTWVGDLLMFPQDPLGRYGPSLEEFLRFPS